MLVIAFLFSFSTPVFAAALNVDDKVNVIDGYEEVTRLVDENITLFNDEKVAIESQYVEITPHNNLATAPPIISWFLGLAANRVISYLTPLVTTAVLNIARNNMPAIMAGVRSACHWSRTGVQDSVFRHLVDAGVATTTARNIGYAVSRVIWP